MLRFLNFFIISLIGLAATASYGLSEPFPTSPAGTLFADDEILNVELDAPLKDLFAKTDANTTEDKVFTQGTLSYFSQNKKVSVPVRLRVKGKSTADICPFKKLEIKFKDADTTNTLFANMKSVDLNTHCAEPGELDEDLQHFNTSFYNHREVAIYKMAETLKVPTYQSRALHIRYKNTALKVDEAKHAYQAFFLEDNGDLLKRIQAREIKPNDFSKNAKIDTSTQLEVISEDLFRASLFNLLIRNPDWDFPCGDGNRFHNLKIIETQSGNWVPLVYDFNLSPIVTTEESYPMVSTCQFKLSDERKLAITESFKEKRAELYALLETLKNDKPAYEVLQICLDKFFE